MFINYYNLRLVVNLSEKTIPNNDITPVVISTASNPWAKAVELVIPPKILNIITDIVVPIAPPNKRNILYIN